MFLFDFYLYLYILPVQMQANPDWPQWPPLPRHQQLQPLTGVAPVLPQPLLTNIGTAPLPKPIIDVSPPLVLPEPSVVSVAQSPGSPKPILACRTVDATTTPPLPLAAAKKRSAGGPLMTPSPPPPPPSEEAGGKQQGNARSLKKAAKTTKEKAAAGLVAPKFKNSIGTGTSTLSVGQISTVEIIHKFTYPGCGMRSKR